MWENRADEVGKIWDDRGQAIVGDEEIWGEKEDVLIFSELL